MTKHEIQYPASITPSIPKGYKLTEVGVIPDDWEIKTVIELVEPTAPICYGIVQVGKHTESGVPIVAIKFLSNIADAELHHASHDIEKAFARSRPQEGDVLISIKGTIGRVGIVPNRFSGNISREIARLRIDTRYSNRFVAHSLESNSTQERIKRSIVGTTRLEFSIATLRRFKVAIPSSRAEQEAIAGALSDADAWIESLEQLIAKKRQIKQGAMQELLTGKRRLPGFSGEWETKRLGEHCHFLKNGTNSRAELTLEGPLKYLHYGDIHSCNSVYMYPNQLPSLPMSKGNTLDRLQNGDLVFADASEDTVGISKSVEIMGTNGSELVAGLHTIAVRFADDLFAPGFAGYLQNCPDLRSHLRKLAAGTKVYATNRRHVSSAEVTAL